MIDLCISLLPGQQTQQGTDVQWAPVNNKEVCSSLFHGMDHPNHLFSIAAVFSFLLNDAWMVGALNRISESSFEERKANE